MNELGSLDLFLQFKIGGGIVIRRGGGGRRSGGKERGESSKSTCIHGLFPSSSLTVRISSESSSKLVSEPVSEVDSESDKALQEDVVDVCESGLISRASMGDLEVEVLTRVAEEATLRVRLGGRTVTGESSGEPRKRKRYLSFSSLYLVQMRANSAGKSWNKLLDDSDWKTF